VEGPNVNGHHPAIAAWNADAVKLKAQLSVLIDFMLSRLGHLPVGEQISSHFIEHVKAMERIISGGMRRVDPPAACAKCGGTGHVGYGGIHRACSCQKS
jgi:hypothetical protein